MYHRFGADETLRRLDPAVLERQLDYVGQNFRVVTLHDIVDRLSSGRDPEPGSVAFTVDDAYGDFGEIAYPIFRRHRIPVTLYVVSEFAGGRMWLWWDAIRYVVMRSPGGTYDLEGRNMSVVLSDAGSRRAAWDHLSSVGLTLRPEQIPSYLVSLQRLFRVELPCRPTSEFAAMSWESLRALDPDLVEIGAHTRTHAILSLCDEERIMDEIGGSKAEIENRIGRSVRSLCYPNGTPDAVNELCPAAARRAGFESAVMSCGGLVTRRADRHALPRISCSGTWHQFVRTISGFSHVRGRARWATFRT
jgi:peptidoglycan/xylan/chitin deacetylase (PgdA/CDA1 family)